MYVCLFFGIGTLSLSWQYRMNKKQWYMWEAEAGGLQEFKTSLGYIMNFRVAWSTMQDLFFLIKNLKNIFNIYFVICFVCFSKKSGPRSRLPLFLPVPPQRPLSPRFPLPPFPFREEQASQCIHSIPGISAEHGTTRYNKARHKFSRQSWARQT